MALVNPHNAYFISEEEYLKTELVSEVRREYVDGRVYAMSGADFNHNVVAGNVFGIFRNHLKESPCHVFVTDMRVRLGKDYVYPDVVVDCAPMRGADLFSQSPVLIVEVLSKSTRRMDTTVKLLRYLNLPSLLEYVLIEPDFVSLQVLRRSNHWLPEYYFLDDSLTFESIGLTACVEEIYDRVDNEDMNEYRRAKSAT